MAISTARRGRVSRRREPSSDGIEEDGPSQAIAVDDSQDIADFDEEEQETPRTTKNSKGAKREKKNKGKAATAAADEGTDVDMALAIQHLQDLGDQPIDKNYASKIGNMADDWARMCSQAHEHSYALIRDVARTVAEFKEGEQGDKILADLDGTMRGLVDTENELRAHEEALKELQQKVVRETRAIDLVAEYEAGVQKQKHQYKLKTSRQKYAKNEEYAKFRHNIHEVRNPDEPMPPVSELIPREDGDDSDDDDEVIIGGVTQDYKCPLTLVLMIDPLTSKTCGHSFSAAAIRDFLGNSQTARKKCPTSGCNQVLALKDLQPDKELAKKAREAARRERMRHEEHEDDEEVIE